MGRTTRLARHRVIRFHRRRQDAAPLRPHGAEYASRTRPHRSPADADISSPALSYHQQCRKRLSRQERPVRRTCPVSRDRHHGDRRPKARKEGGNSASVPERTILLYQCLMSWRWAQSSANHSPMDNSPLPTRLYREFRFRSRSSTRSGFLRRLPLLENLNSLVTSVPYADLTTGS